MNRQLKTHFLNCLVIVIIAILITEISSSLFKSGIHVENILMLYVFGCLVVITKTKGYVYGVVSSILFVLIFNFLFVEPIYTLKVNDMNYVISFVIFLVVVIIVTTLTVSLQKQIIVAKSAEKTADNLYKISSGYLNIIGRENIARYGIKSLNMIYPATYYIYIPNKEKEIKDIFYDINGKIRNDCISEEFLHEVRQCMEQGNQKTNEKFSILYKDKVLFPIISNGRSLGVVISLFHIPLEEENIKLIYAVLSQIAVAIDREEANEEKEKSYMLSEREKLRNNLLRSISHDLRTPLAGITGSVSFLLESYLAIDDESRESLLSDILEDSIWLSNMVDNLLNMTRLQEGELAIHRANEVVDDIISETVARVQKRMGKRTLKLELEQQLMVVPMDGQLIIQVLINLIDNAIKHTSKDGIIYIKTNKMEQNNQIYFRFSIEDNGTGILESLIPTMFDEFITDDKMSDSKRGVGLGLSISKAIVKAHNGIINGYNKETGGACVYFLLPMEGKK